MALDPIVRGPALPSHEGNRQRGHRQADCQPSQPPSATGLIGLVARFNGLAHGFPEGLAMLVLVKNGHCTLPRFVWLALPS